MPAFSTPTGRHWTCLYWDGFLTVIENVFHNINPAFLFLTSVLWYIALLYLNLLQCFKNTVQHAEDLEKIFSGFTNSQESFSPHKHPCQRVCKENKSTSVTCMLLVTNVSSAVSLENNSSSLSRPALTLDLAALSCPPGPLWYHEAAQQNQKTNLFLSQLREWKLSKLATQLLFQRAQSWRRARAARRWERRLRSFRCVGKAEVMRFVESASLCLLFTMASRHQVQDSVCSIFVLTLHQWKCHSTKELWFPLKHCSHGLFRPACCPSCAYNQPAWRRDEGSLAARARTAHC